MPKASHRRLTGLLGILGALLALMVAGAGPASAHATLQSTDPAQNSVVATAPSFVTLTFSESVSLSGDSVRVLDPAGRPVDSGNPGHADGRENTARVGLNSGLAGGTYTVAWRAVSDDSHPVGGAFTFSIGAPSDTSVSTTALQQAKADSLVAALYGTGRTVAYGAFALLMGAAGFVLLCWPAGAAVRTVQRLLMTGWVALLLSTIAVLLLRGPYERGSGLGQAFDLSLVRTTLDERIGTALAARLLLLATAGVFLSLLVGQLGGPVPAKADGGTDPDTRTATGSDTGTDPGTDPGTGPGTGPDEDADEDADEDELRRLEERAADRPQREARIGLGVAGLLLAVALSATWVGADHASVGIQVWLALPFGILHLIAMALWLGGLATLLVGLRHGLGAETADRFSKIAFGSVAALTVTGIYQSWRGLGSWGALVDTEYGRLLLIKVGCVAAMLGVAWISRSWVARLRTAGAEPAAVAAAAAAAEQEATGVAGAAEQRDSSEERDARIERPAEELVTAGTGSNGATGPVDPARQAQLDRQRAARRNAGRERDFTPAKAGLRRSVLVEAGVAVAVLVVTTMLTNSPPGRVAQAVAASADRPAASAPAGGAAGGAQAPQTVPGQTMELKLPYDTGGRTANAKGTATVTLNPARAGANEVHLKLDGPDGQPVEVPEVQLAFTLPDRDLGPLPVALTTEGTGRWTGTAQLPLAGNWVVSVVVRSSDIDQATETKSLKIG
ncbi:FixH family protein [Kitasatospora sp. NBC_00240]|uniref:copper resistance CopC/CopD family protein n=1 Tax=Kitasatospora sp. NBC_00240 TaxID=2903567 RepID=UPI00225524F9|nr:FixH family protein [Kitasatospora sp. NBC_00240]MCX5211576.1 FixH family protein [Kitasatospora sp. NBC_00240]